MTIAGLLPDQPREEAVFGMAALLRLRRTELHCAGARKTRRIARAGKTANNWVSHG